MEINSGLTALPTGLLALPEELVQHILSYLDPLELASAAQTCKSLATQTADDQLWQPFVNRELPEPISSPAPLKSFRDLYVAHFPYWFLVKRRLWFGDGEHHGKLVAARYNPQQGCIEAYTVVAQRGRHHLQVWEKDREVIIHSFDPKVMLDLSKPVLKLDVDSLRTNDQPNNHPSDRAYAPPSNYSKEIVMEMVADSGLYSSFMLCRKLAERAITEQTAVWPHLRFPTPTRVRNDTHNGYQSAGHRPTRLGEVSDYHFRLRKWVEYSGRRASPVSMTTSGLQAALGLMGPYFAANLPSTSAGGMGIRIPEDITTFAALPEWCLRPTPQKPWQGIWCGDYSGHGCEFLLLLQPDKKDERPLPSGMNWLSRWFRGGRRGSESSNDTYTSAQEELDGDETAGDKSVPPVATATMAGASAPPALYQTILEGFMQTHERESGRENEPTPSTSDDQPSGRIEAIKLTGDPNVPRGEYTFIAPDIGPGGLIRIADEAIFRGARVVRSAGHIAGRGFREDQWIPSQMIMISANRIAQFWEGFGHISQYQRVDIDALMNYAG